MVRKLFASAAVAVLLLLALAPADSSAFSLTATRASAFVAYDSDYDVINQYNLDPRLSYESTGQHFNFAAGLTFAFEYLPTYPTLDDVINNPTERWMWTIEAKNLVLPYRDPLHLPNVSISRPGSYADLVHGLGWVSDQLGQYGVEGRYFFDYEMLTENTGIGTLSMGIRVPNELLPCNTPDQFLIAGNPSGSFSLTAEPVPEPATMLLFGGGLAGVAAWRRRRNTKKS